MRNVIKMVALLAFLGNREALAQTVGLAQSPTKSMTATATLKPTQDSRSKSVGLAPIGHRQPRVRDLPFEAVSELDRLSAEDSAVDRKLIICHGC
jgi:hypothetical protein